MPEPGDIVYVTRGPRGYNTHAIFAVNLTPPHRAAMSAGCDIRFWARTSTILLDSRHRKKWFPKMADIPIGVVVKCVWPTLEKADAKR